MTDSTCAKIYENSHIDKHAKSSPQDDYSSNEIARDTQATISKYFKDGESNYSYYGAWLYALKNKISYHNKICKNIHESIKNFNADRPVAPIVSGVPNYAQNIETIKTLKDANELMKETNTLHEYEEKLNQCRLILEDTPKYIEKQKKKLKSAKITKDKIKFINRMSDAKQEMKDAKIEATSLQIKIKNSKSKIHLLMKELKIKDIKGLETIMDRDIIIKGL